jgi:enamine deaminase RidA (YjgF/YER057c/UK114 family)
MRYRRIAILTAVFLAAAFAGKKKNPDDKTQVLELPKDPPMVAIGTTSRLVFQVSPLSAKGLLSQQTRDALKAILKANGGAPVIHIRAFVAGSGDLRRVPQIVSEVFTAKKMPLPSVSVVLAGGLPLEDAQIEIEAVSEARDARKDVNPNGLTFLEAAPPDQLVSRLATSMPLQVTCFVSSLDGANPLAARFPSAAVDIVQTQRTPTRPDTRCEAVARGGRIAPRLAFTGTQVAFGSDQKAASLAYKRLDQELNTAGISPSDILETHVYALSERLGTLAFNTRYNPTAFTVVSFEGVTSLDGSFAIDYIAPMK